MEDCMWTVKCSEQQAVQFSLLVLFCWCYREGACEIRDIIHDWAHTKGRKSLLTFSGIAVFDLFGVSLCIYFDISTHRQCRPIDD